jgi:signal peptidase I
VQQPTRVAPLSRAIQQRRAHLARDIIEVLVLIGIVFLITKFAIQGRAVTDSTMRPTLSPSQLVLVNTISYYFGDPQRGDVIAFHNPSDPSQIIMRRIIGVPNDVVALTATTVVLNGVTLSEPYVSVPFGQAQNSNIDPGTKVGSNEYYVMCDSRVSSDCATSNSDSRNPQFGLVPRNYIVGKAVMVYWPINQIHLLQNYSDVFSQATKAAGK